MLAQLLKAQNVRQGLENISFMQQQLCLELSSLLLSSPSNFVLSYWIWRRVTWFVSGWDRESGHGPGHAWASGSGQVAFKVPSKLNHTTILWLRAQILSLKPPGACTYFSTKQMRLSGCHDNRENLLIPLKTARSMWHLVPSGFPCAICPLHLQAGTAQHHHDLHGDGEHHGENVFLVWILVGIERAVQYHGFRTRNSSRAGLPTGVSAVSVLLLQSCWTKITPYILWDRPILLKQSLWLPICSLKINPMSLQSHIPMPCGPPGREMLFKENKN